MAQGRHINNINPLSRFPLPALTTLTLSLLLSPAHGPTAGITDITDINPH